MGEIWQCAFLNTNVPWEGLFLLPRSARVSKKIGEYFRISENNILDIPPTAGRRRKPSDAVVLDIQGAFMVLIINHPLWRKKCAKANLQLTQNKHLPFEYW